MLPNYSAISGKHDNFFIQFRVEINTFCNVLLITLKYGHNVWFVLTVEVF